MKFSTKMPREEAGKAGCVKIYHGTDEAEGKSNDDLHVLGLHVSFGNISELEDSRFARMFTEY